MTSPIYRGPMVANIVAAAQQQAEEANAQAEVNDMTDSQDGNAVRLEGQDGQTAGFGNHAGDAVPQLNVTRVSAPCRTRGLPSNLATNPLKGSK